MPSSGTRPVVGLVAPGAMGSAVAAGGARVAWAGKGRSAATAARAATDGLEDVGELRTLVDKADVLLSVCPPHAAVDVARAVAELGFDGRYVDVNAVSPETAGTIAGIVEPTAQFVDGGITGAPPRRTGPSTRLFLAGAGAGEVASLFRAGPLRTVVLDGGVPAASVLKIAYAAWTKGSTALLLAVRTFATAEGIERDLLAHWAEAKPELLRRIESDTATASPRAWRWAGEMDEIAASFDAAGLPTGFPQAAAQVYQRLAGRKDQPGTTIDDVVADLLAGGDD